MGQGRYVVEETGVEELRFSSERIGKLYPVILDKYGNVIDGKHRLAADENWPKVKLESIRTDKQRLMARIISNVCRRTVSPIEKRKLLGELAEIWSREGIAGSQIAYRIAEETGLTYRWVMKYLPDSYKERPGLGGPSKSFGLYKGKAESCSTKEYEQLFFTLSSEPKQNIIVKSYSNTMFVNLAIDKRFYARIEVAAAKLGLTPETIINNVMSFVVRKMEDFAQSMAPKEEPLLT